MSGLLRSLQSILNFPPWFVLLQKSFPKFYILIWLLNSSINHTLIIDLTHVFRARERQLSVGLLNSLSDNGIVHDRLVKHGGRGSAISVIIRPHHFRTTLGYSAVHVYNLDFRFIRLIDFWQDHIWSLFWLVRVIASEWLSQILQIS